MPCRAFKQPITIVGCPFWQSPLMPLKVIDLTIAPINLSEHHGPLQGIIGVHIAVEALGERRQVCRNWYFIKTCPHLIERC